MYDTKINVDTMLNNLTEDILKGIINTIINSTKAFPPRPTKCSRWHFLTRPAVNIAVNKIDI